MANNRYVCVTNLAKRAWQKLFILLIFIKDKQTVKFKQTDCQSGNILTHIFSGNFSRYFYRLTRFSFFNEIQILIPIIGNINANVRECVFVSKRN